MNKKIEFNCNIDDIHFLINQFDKLKDSSKIILPTELIENIRYLPEELTELPGKFDFGKSPFFIEPLNRLHPDDLSRKIVLMKPSQIGATTNLIENGIAYKIKESPSGQLYISADKELVTTAMTIKVERMIDSCDLRDLIFSQTSVKSKQTGDTKTEKQYPGGFLHAIGARNPGKLRQMSYPIIWFDELDGMPLKVGNEGSPIDLAEKRTKGFSKSKKIYYLSTPTTEQASQIFQLYLLGDQRNWYMPCIHCEIMQVFKWHGKTENGFEYGIKFEIEDGLPIYESITYQCPHCKKHMKDSDKIQILPYGEWRPTAKSKEPGLYSYWINSLIAHPSIYSWNEIVMAWCKAWNLEKNKCKDIEKLRVFYNHERGLPFREPNIQIKRERVQQYRNYNYLKNFLNNKEFRKYSESEILFILCTVDVQKYNLWVHIIGYTYGGRNYTIDFFSIDCEKDNENGVENERSIAWIELDKFLTQKTWVDNEGREYRIINTFIDSGKYTDFVYKFCKQYSAGVYAIKGQDYINGGLIYKEFNKKTIDETGLNTAFHLNTTMLKDRIAKYFNLVWETGKNQPEWYPNFPEDMREDIFEQFESEEKVVEREKKTNKYLRSYWRLIPGRENHCFDTYCYNLGLLEYTADRICRDEEILNLEYLDWKSFWEYAKTGIYYIQR